MCLVLCFKLYVLYVLFGVFLVVLNMGKFGKMNVVNVFLKVFIKSSFEVSSIFFVFFSFLLRRNLNFCINVDIICFLLGILNFVV